MISKNFGLIVLSISLFALAGLFLLNGVEPAVNLNKGFGIDTNLDKGFEPLSTLENQVSYKSNIQNTGPSDIAPGEIRNFTESEETGLSFSGDILTCSNITDTEQVVDIRLTNRDPGNKSITIYPMNLTFNLLPGQIKRIDIPLPYGTSILTLVSIDGEELKAQVPLCFSRGSSGSDTISFAARTTPNVDEIPEFPSIGLPVLSILALLFLFKKNNK